MIPIDTADGSPRNTRVAAALSATDSSTRLQAALAVGSDPDPALLETLVERCAVEPDFFVRDMLSWALTRLPPGRTLPRIRRELDSENAQARGQALHTLSKIGDRDAWAWITPALLHDADDEVARTAWRLAVALVPEDSRESLAGDLVAQLGRGERDVQRSLSRALVALGDLIVPALEKAAASPDLTVAAHAHATELLLRDPEAGFPGALDEARRVLALGPQRAAALAAAASEPPEAVRAAPTAGSDATTGSAEAATGGTTTKAADC